MTFLVTSTLYNSTHKQDHSRAEKSSELMRQCATWKRFAWIHVAANVSNGTQIVKNFKFKMEKCDKLSTKQWNDNLN